MEPITCAPLFKGEAKNGGSIKTVDGGPEIGAVAPELVDGFEFTMPKQ